MKNYKLKSFLIILSLFLIACSTAEQPARKNVEIIYHETDKTDDIGEQKALEIVKPKKLEETDEITIISRDATSDANEKSASPQTLPPPPASPSEDAEKTENTENAGSEITPPITESRVIDLYMGQTLIIQHNNKNYKLRMSGVINNKTAKVIVNEDTKLFSKGNYLIFNDLKFETLDVIINAPYELPSDQVQLHLLTDKGLITVFLEDGQKKFIKTTTQEFAIEAMAISSFRGIPIVKLKVNNNELKSMQEDDIEYVSPELQIYVADLFLNEKETGKRDLVKFYFSKIR